MAIRIIAFPIWVLLTSWMDLGQEYDDAETFGWSRISFNYQNHVQDSLRVSSEQAAKRIFEGMGKRQFEIHFPKRFTFILKCLSWLPEMLLIKILAEKPIK